MILGSITTALQTIRSPKLSRLVRESSGALQASFLSKFNAECISGLSVKKLNDRFNRLTD